MPGDEETNTAIFTSKKVRSIIGAYLFSKFAFYYILLIIYLLLGGVFFHFLEGSDEVLKRDALTEELAKVRSNIELFLKSVNISNDTINDSQVNLMGSYIVELSQNLSILMFQSSSIMKWSYPRSVYFSFIAITTIGYGQLAPTTSHGQIFLCLYALFGIPIFLILVTETSTRITNAFDRFVLSRLESERYRWIAIVIGFIAGLIALIFIPAAIFGVIESWRYSTSTYFAFVTLSTIGFGDFVLANNPDAGYNKVRAVGELYLISTILWLYLGLVFIAILIEQVGTGIMKFEKYISKLIDRYLAKRSEDRGDILQGVLDTKLHSNDNELLPSTSVTS